MVIYCIGVRNFYEKITDDITITFEVADSEVVI